MRRWTIGLVLALAVGPLLVGCGQEQQAAPAAEQESAGDTYSSTTLNTSYDDALNASTQLILGTIRLEETGDTVTAEQAKSLLPLWQSLQGGVTAQAEVNAVLKQIESTMTQDQLAAIAAMRLTQEDLRSWMQEQGMGGGFAGPGGGQGLSSDEMATRQAEFGNMSEEDRANMRATMEAGGGFPGGGQFGNMSEEERENMRATMEAGGGFPGGGQFGNMSEEERESLRATREAGGGGMPGGGGAGGRGGAGRGMFGFMLNPLIELLTQRAGE